MITLKNFQKSAGKGRAKRIEVKYADSSSAAVLMMADEPRLRESLRHSLESSGYRVLEEFDMARMRGGDQRVPVNSSREEAVEIARFEGDKPFALMIVSPQAKRPAPACEGGGTETNMRGFLTGQFQWGSLAIDFDDHVVKVAGQRVQLTLTEYSLLRLLAERAGKLVTYPQIMRRIWGQDNGSSRACLRVYACSLRKKLRSPASEDLVLTEPGIGYRLAEAAFPAGNRG
jgi:DNA-binding winged helix-turn-helix (wHTH) protein